uniref:Aspartate/glutamate/uridylate kinase domain-containing protein n=1 Tax=Neobodo designis TaxID=312471 RepID=A0A7S1LG93_NEODS|mmetsp:Transcript_21514/g.66736  ORF Transcript_21514/g.66736 Transcript_21514/m.66736 type:complete len:363 (+) Transcript_21514:237-1325(+)
MNPALLHKRDSPRLDSVRCRADLGRAQRVVIKAGTSTIVDSDGYPSLRRISQIAEDVCAIRRAGREVIFVSSGAVGVGRNTLRRQAILGSSAFDRLHRTEERAPIGPNVLAAAGSASLMTLYQTLFSQLDTTVSELLLTKHDFETADRKENLSNALDNLLLHGIVPIVNENDAVTAGSRKSGDPFNDNDGLAALVASQMNADLMILLTDVDGLYDRPPSEPSARLIPTYPGEAAFASIQFGAKSSVGRGGMQAKIEAAMRAIDWGVPAVMVTNGAKPGAIQSVFNGTMSGTLFVEDPTPILEHEKANDVGLAVAQAHQCRDASRPLVDLTEGAANMSLLVVDAACHASDPPRDAHARVTHAR